MCNTITLPAVRKQRALEESAPDSGNRQFGDRPRS